jgi:hypothetical protein
MKKANGNGTPDYARLHKRGLTIPQQNAVDALAAGKNDTETAEALGVNRVTVTRWRLYHPVFQAAINARRAEIWGAGVNRLRDLVPKALDALGGLLTTGNSAARLKAAAAILQLARLPAAGEGIGPTDAEEIVAGLVRERIATNQAARQRGMSATDRLLADISSVTPEEMDAEERQARAEVLAELDAALADADDATARGN